MQPSSHQRRLAGRGVVREVRASKGERVRIAWPVNPGDAISGAPGGVAVSVNLVASFGRSGLVGWRGGRRGCRGERRDEWRWIIGEGEEWTRRELGHQEVFLDG